ncbi:MAG: hypothetical protein KC506_02445, partial [Nanoarchaeota archaeon]|nr:hypothetical protein [Nanoarchaeota archaeon]
KNPTLSVRDYSSPKDKGKVERMCGEKEVQGFRQAHLPFLEMPESEKRLQLILESEKRTAAFLLLDEISRECIAFNAIITDSTMPGIAAAAIYRGAALAAAKGYRYFNFQGSETKSLDRWKRKFNPAPMEKTHLIYKAFSS